MKYSVSIIVPVYGVESYIEDCVRSVMAQDYDGPLECVLVNDCTPDRSIEMAKQVLSDYKGAIEFRIVTHERNQGLSGARNTGIKESKGEYVYLLDSDDEISSNCISSLVAPLAIKRYEMVVGEYAVQGAEDIYPHANVPDREFVGLRQIVTAKRTGTWYQMAVNKLYDKAFLTKNNLSFCEGIIHEDELFSAELACVLESMYVKSSACTYTYKIREGSITTSQKVNRKLESYQRILTEFQKFLVGRGMDKLPETNELRQLLFHQACEIAYKYDLSRYAQSYDRFRDIACNRYAERFWQNFRLRALIRDFHYLFPSVLGKYVFRFINLRS